MIPSETGEFISVLGGDGRMAAGGALTAAGDASDWISPQWLARICP